MNVLTEHDEALRLARIYCASVSADDSANILLIARALIAYHAEYARLDTDLIGVGMNAANQINMSFHKYEEEKAECARLRKELMAMRAAFKAFNGVVARIDDIIGKECA